MCPIVVFDREASEQLAAVTLIYIKPLQDVE
jgi:hypothetical protein